MREVLDSDEEFRHRVAEGLKVGEPDRASWLFLARPDGWKDEYDLLSDAWQEELLAKESSSLQHRHDQLAQTLERTRRELAAAQDALREAGSRLADERDSLSGVARERDALAAQVADLEAERSTVIRNLKAAEARSVERLARIRVLEAELEELRALQLRQAEGTQRTQSGAQNQQAWELSPSAGSPVEQPHLIAPPVVKQDSPWDGIDPRSVGEAVADAVRALSQVGDALNSVARVLGAANVAGGVTDCYDDTATAPPAAVELKSSTADHGERESHSEERPPRRSPVRMLRGATEGSRDALEQLFSTPQIVVYVDGYNVTMEAWPQLNGSDQRRSLIDMLGALAARTKAEIHVVFDGDDDGRRPTVSAPLPIRVHFSHADVEADDQILSLVAALATNRPVLVVSTDGRVKTGARRLGANTADSSELLEFVRRPPR